MDLDNYTRLATVPEKRAPSTSLGHFHLITAGVTDVFVVDLRRKKADAVTHMEETIQFNRKDLAIVKPLETERNRRD